MILCCARVDDVLIRGGHLIDGSGAPGRDADVALRDGRVGAVEPRSARPVRRVIDARGQVVAPGFIDIHTNSTSPCRSIRAPNRRSARA
jgi:N-acyl-D-aspartate/D-glutamate deacylase